MSGKIKKSILTISGILVPALCLALDWTDISSGYSGLPDAVRVYKAVRSDPALEIFYMDVDLNDEAVAVRSYLDTSPAVVSTLSDRYNCIGAVNGGYFSGAVSYAAVVYPGELKARNIAAVTRNSQSYPLMRSFFSLDTSLTPAINWIYHFDNTLDGVYQFEQPLAYTSESAAPLTSPQKSEGQKMQNLLTGIGGGPTLIRDSVITVTYYEEIFWGSGVGLTNNDPRTAVGFTSDNHIILITADGRQTQSEGVSLNEMAQILLSLKCTYAMNLDGGGSTQMAIGNTFVNSPSEYRSVPSILAVVVRDSLTGGSSQNSPTTGWIIDTISDSVDVIGNDWFETANEGYYGTTPALLNAIGDGSSQVVFNYYPQQVVTADVYAWWVAASNRCTDTPFIIKHQTGSDTLRVNQTARHAQWVKLGTYTFGNRGNQAVVVSDAGTAGTYVVADAVKFVTQDSSTSEIIVTAPVATSETVRLCANYPNPFNPTTNIQFFLSHSSPVNLEVFNLEGKKIRSLVNGESYSAGYHNVDFLAQDLPSGIYLGRLTSRCGSDVIKMALVK